MSKNFQKITRTILHYNTANLQWLQCASFSEIIEAHNRLNVRITDAAIRQWQISSSLLHGPSWIL